VGAGVFHDANFGNDQNGPFNGGGASNPWQARPSDDMDDGTDESKAKANRFSKFAPSTNLGADDFRKQLKENMKADLERRRRQDPNRGNQPARSYLDSL